ncbi:hypothetical protein C0J52_20929 [Blattella germanica]|nr:hypothetical protein C0J52_20929 [Blattella germanica]
MSILYTFKNGWLICHEDFIRKIYENVQGKQFSFDSCLFEINTPFARAYSSNKNDVTSDIPSNLLKKKYKKRKIITPDMTDVTHEGKPVCHFSPPPGKQPFEQIVFGRRKGGKRDQPLPEANKLLVSVPSAIHSHKPPLTDLLAPYLPPKPQRLELFARYLLPGWTSWGYEVLKLQHYSLYKELKR